MIQIPSDRILNWKSFNVFVEELTKDIEIAVYRARKKAIARIGLELSLGGIIGLRIEDLKVLTWDNLLPDNTNKIVLLRNGSTIQFDFKERENLKQLIHLSYKVLKPYSISQNVFCGPLTDQSHVAYSKFLSCYNFSNLPRSLDPWRDIYSKRYLIIHNRRDKNRFNLFDSLVQQNIHFTDPRFYIDRSVKLLEEFKIVKGIYDLD